MKVGRWILLAAVVGGAGYYGWTRYERARSAAGAQLDAPVDAKAPPNTRIKVEVLNATTTKGLARRATLFLRDRGFDVVAIGTAREQRETTLVIDRSNHPAWARLIANALGATITSRPDSSRYVDATVLVGASWHPPAKPFYP
ncbi:MAG TPA: LytR C-terminal domain-containing protein [Gemmatimonadaceae bacterium]|nr:LytR C-terminal domain-containing protein [Gemmatimonadaceae bacterium]